MGKRGPPCQCCNHPQRHHLEVMLANAVPAAVIGAKFQVDEQAVRRHAKNHVTTAMRAAILTASAPGDADLDKLRTSESEGLIARIMHLRAKIQTYQDAAYAAGDLVALDRLIGRELDNEEFSAKILGMLIQRYDVQTKSYVVSADYQRTRQVIINALRPHPEAARAVVAALRAVEADVATDVLRAAGRAPVMIEAKPITVPPAPMPPRGI